MKRKSPSSSSSTATSASWQIQKGRRTTSLSGEKLLNPTLMDEPISRIHAEDTVKILSWNVNGLKAFLHKSSFSDILEQEAPLGLLLMQETKANREKPLPPLGQYVDESAYATHWHHSQSKLGYAGSAACANTELIAEPLRVVSGLCVDGVEHDDTGRVITLEYPGIHVVSVYTKNSGPKLKNIEERKAWNVALESYVARLKETQKAVLIIGDFNVAHHKADIHQPKQAKNQAGFSQQERDDFSRLLNCGFVDTFREHHPLPSEVSEGTEGTYTYWTYRSNARAQNKGWRLDYALISEEHKDHVKKSFIRNEVLGSDHCPIGVLLSKELFLDQDKD